jgi:deoxyribonuclease IV
LKGLIKIILLKSSRSKNQPVNKEERKIGVHLSISGGLVKSLQRAEELKINTMQIFLKNSNRWQAPGYKTEDVEAFKTGWEEMKGVAIFAHSGYLINLAGKGDNLDKSIEAMADELRRAETLGIRSIVVHPGSHLGVGIDEGIKQAALSLDRAYREAGDTHVEILLETTAGQGSSVGHSFSHLAGIINESKNAGKLNVCLDTCHIFAAGYDISKKQGLLKTIDEFDSEIGLERLKLIHLNDSKRELGSRVDRHEHIGKGEIGPGGFKNLVNHDKLKEVPLILETPKTDESSDRENLKKVRGMFV